MLVLALDVGELHLVY